MNAHGPAPAQRDVVIDLITPGPLQALAALLDHRSPPWAEGLVPPLGHWLYFHSTTPQSSLGSDGHPPREGSEAREFPRRMWAGSRVHFVKPIATGLELQRETTLIASQRKSGRSGEMLLVTVRHLLTCDGETLIEEEQDLVYRGPASGPAATASPAASTQPDTEAHRIVVPDETALFRFSALTFNAHRIHYDLPYAVQKEGYPALVVQGPFTAMLLMDCWLRTTPGAMPRRFEFRAQRPLFCGRPIALHMSDADNICALRAADPEGRTAISATILRQ